jgi:hypothetical protein
MMITAYETEINTLANIDELLAANLEKGRAYWLAEAADGYPVPSDMAEFYSIDQINAALANDEDYADFLAQTMTGIPQF